MGGATGLEAARPLEQLALEDGSAFGFALCPSARSRAATALPARASSGGAFEQRRYTADVLQARVTAAASLLFAAGNSGCSAALMEAADGSGRKRPRSAVDVSEDDGAGANAGEEAQVDVVAEDAAAKRQRPEVWPLAQDSLAGCA
jgi:hypothetical protein